MNDLVTAVRNADHARAVVLVEELDGARRKDALPALRELRRELVRRDGLGPGWDALWVIGAVCQPTPAEAADWLAHGEIDTVAAWDRPPLLGLLEAQPSHWQREVGLRLANRRAGRTDDWGSGLLFRLAEHLLRRSDTPPPGEPNLVVDWMRDRSSTLFRSAVTVLPPDTDLRTRLRADSFTPVLAPLVFEGPTARWFDHFARRRESERWVPALVELVADGTIDRSAFLARGFARLVRGGAVGELRTYLELLRALAPGVDELAGSRRALLALLDGDSVVAGSALEWLVVLDGAGLLGEAEVAEAAGVLAVRPEKKVVRALLGWLDRVAAGGRVVVALGGVAGCFGHPDRQVQELALKVLKRHAGVVEGELSVQLRAAALLLDPVRAGVAAELLGASVGSEPVGAAQDDRLPEPPRPVRVPGPLGSPAEVAEELAAALAADDESVRFERVLDGLVRQVWTDRAALAAALAPLGRSWEPLHGLARVVVGAEPPGLLAQLLQHRPEYAHAFGSVLAARLHEAATHRVPFLLATPTHANGALDARELVTRLERYEELGVQPGPVDFAQALLRTAADGGGEGGGDGGGGGEGSGDGGGEGAERLASDAGRQLAAWLRDGGLPREATVVVPKGENGYRYCEQPAPDTGRLAVAPGAELPEAVRLLLGPRAEREERYRGRGWRIDDRATAILPHHREETAARLLPRPGGDRTALLLAESTGPCGPAVHLLLARCCDADPGPARAVTVDALLSLAAQRALDPAALGREAGALVRDGALRPNRLAAVLTDLATAGAPRLAWAALAGLLPVLLAEPLPGGAAELLATAVDRARETAAGGAIAAVTRLATGGGRSKAVTEARRLAELLG
ncbi:MULTISPECIES: DUF6493 family protein [Kitasatospora]|uniref:DUF7824 domain-containing protein n=1 Tax=Kitasatospora setae (strain ATCC 33774 / DSM 43861 / JCM 3304 / KCC A-0304 / NBRC 14216 / KM-6054) TaxID=452652 RepID=E4N1Z0_KITSK|nr:MULTISPECIES: DUF6493 family protein [Kitasatospora]BAJ32174.1 hypothetical protein KSE_64150 [Kitasatospora setae KM-6054]